ncbi:MAG: T9SS type A sorting domain-containing protein [Spirosomataceae bacterium]
MNKYPRFFLIIIFLVGDLGLFAQSIVTNDISGGTACAGVTISVSFVASNLPNPTNRLFVVQLSNNGGLFTNPTALVTGKSSPISVILPANILGGDYRLRVVSDTTGVNYTPSAVFMILKRPTATLAGDTTINVGGSATLSLFFSGNGPWTYTFTNTTSGTTPTNPFKGIVQPTTSTIYALQSVSNICGTGTVAGSAKVTVIPRINTDFTTTTICAGASTSVPFSLTGTFETATINYTAQLSNIIGDFSNPIAIGTGTSSPINISLPSNLPPSNTYRIRVIANANATSTTSSTITVKPLPTAILSGSSTITIGESANLNISLTGDAPWTIRLSNNQTVTANSSPAVANVTPTITTTYTLQSVSNACGNGTIAGNAMVSVLPKISVANVTLGSVCVGTSISLPFIVTGSFDTPVFYTAQLSDASGSFSSPLNLAIGSNSPLAITLPTNLPAGSDYRLRVVANTNATSVVSPLFAVKIRPTATISGNSTINFGENASLTLSFTGEAPWTFTLSDGTTTTADRTPFIINVKPSQSFSYSLNSVRNPCGEGSTSGSASVIVIPRLITENPTTGICAGKDIEVKFTIGGNIAANTTFQAQLSDSLGNFNNPFIIGGGDSSPILSIIPNNVPPGSSYRLRVVVVGNPSITTYPSSSFFLGRKPTATLSGGGSFLVKPGEEVFLVIQFTGDAPWSYLLSDNTIGTATSTPTILPVSPLLPTTYTLKSVGNICGEGTVSGTATVNVIITGVEDLLEEDVLIFPNPIADRINLKINISTTSEWQIIDMQSHIWLQKLGLNHRQSEIIDTSLLPSGAYIFRLKVGEQWLTQKIVKE